MIPKIIHYCWFGGKEKDSLSKKCIKTWHKKLKGYKFIEWNETNFDITSSEYVMQAYKAKKWAFVCDYVRFFVLCKYGGIYLDCDVKILKKLDDLLNCEAFTSFEGAHTSQRPLLECAIMGSVKEGKWVKEMLHYFDELQFPQGNDVNLRDIVLPKPIAERTMDKFGLIPDGSFQKLNGLTVYPKEILSPLNGETKESIVSDKSYTIHLFNNSYALNDDTLYLSRVMNRYGRKKGKIIMVLFHPIRSIRLYYRKRK